MKKFSNNVALNDVFLTVERRVSDTGSAYYVLVAHVYAEVEETVDIGFLSSEIEFRLYKAGVDIR